MEFNEYQEKAKTTAIYPKVNLGFEYPAMGLAGEVGEILNKLKKVHRDKIPLDESLKEDMTKELGDVLWYLSALASEFNINLNDIAEKNIEKLFSRKDRGTLKGSGDNR